MTAISATPKKRNHPSIKYRIDLAKEFLELPMDALVTSAQYAAFLGVSEAKLARDRREGGGVPYIKHGRNVRYVKRFVLEQLLKDCQQRIRSRKELQV